jgi:hypothetical protein
VFCRNKPMAEFRACIEQVSRGKIWAKQHRNGVSARSSEKRAILRRH